MDLNSLEALLSIYEHGSFSKAAKNLHKTQSAISQQIAKLESILNTKIYIRGKNHKITTDGEFLIHHAKKIMDIKSDILHYFNNKDERAEIKLGIPDDLVSSLYLEWIIEFISQNRNIKLNISTDLTLNLITQFERGNLDIILSKINKFNNLFTTRSIGVETLAWVGNESLIDNNILPLILAPEPCIYRKNIIHALEANNIKWTQVFSSQNYWATIKGLNHNVGITALPMNLIPENINIIKNSMLPKLHDIEFVLIKRTSPINLGLDMLEEFILSKIKSGKCQK